MWLETKTGPNGVKETTPSLPDASVLDLCGGSLHEGPDVFSSLTSDFYHSNKGKQQHPKTWFIRICV